MRCGLAEVNITPPLGVPIPGQLYDRRSTGIKDDLFAKAVVVDDGTNIAAFVTLDALAVERDIVSAIRERISNATGILPEAIMVSATHTHTGPPIIAVYGNRRDDEYVNYMIKKASDAAILAFKDLRPVEIGAGIGHEDSIAFNRRFLMEDGTVLTNPGVNNPSIVKPIGPIDPQLVVLMIDDKDGYPLGAILNYTCHLDVVGGDEYSADYPGEISKVLKRLYGDDFVSIFFTGTCGNINHIDVTGKMDTKGEHYKKMGRILAGEAFKVMQNVEYIDEPKVSFDSRYVKVGVRKAGAEDIERAKKVLKSSDSTESDILFARDIIALSKSPIDAVELEVQVIGIGEFVVVGLPGEVFVEFGLDIKNKSKFKYTVVSELTNGSHGYIPVREAFEQGGYEPRLSQYTNLVPETGYILVDKAVEILDLI